MPDANPVTLRVAELNRRLAAVPFEPFAIVMSNGERLEVPHPDYVTITKHLRRIEWESAVPELRIVDVNPLHIAAIERLRPAA